MLKKIVLFALLMFPVVTFAQESQKIAYVNYAEVIYSMPEIKQMDDSLRKSENEFQVELKALSDEYQKKLSDYIAQRDSLNESIRTRREQDLRGLEERATIFQQEAQQKQEELQRALLIPIQTKLQKAIDDVGRENNFLYILAAQGVLYASPNATDATPLVKKKLGIQ